MVFAVEPLINIPLTDLLYIFLPRMIAATLVGGLIGLERELRHQVVGVKTNILICAGATLFSTVSLMFVVDPSRVIAQIVSGIGFVGASAVFKDKDRVRGVTTAAFIWVVAALGVIIGMGGLYIAIILALGLVIVIEVLAYFEKFISK